jgi:BirA family biotin operon repressor/biotin-[acetyl-CoA-carboxylase] ligase
MFAREIWRFPTRHVGRHVAVYTRLSSTNTVASEWLARSPQQGEGWAILAEEQTAGRGQYNRPWQAPSGKALLLSVIVQPPAALTRPVVLTAWVAVAVADAIRDMTDQDTVIKWPNDLLLQKRKVCGILIERHGSATIAGIGLNLNQLAEDWTILNLPHAISLYQATKRRITIRQATERVLYRLDHHYTSLLEGNLELLVERWRNGLGLLGRRVRLELADGEEAVGTLCTLDFDTVALATPTELLAWAPERITHLYLSDDP